MQAAPAEGMPTWKINTRLRCIIAECARGVVGKSGGFGAWRHCGCGSGGWNRNRSGEGPGGGMEVRSKENGVTMSDDVG